VKLTKTVDLLARPRGFEPLTLGLEIIILKYNPMSHVKSGATSGTRKIERKWYFE